MFPGAKVSEPTELTFSDLTGANFFLRSWKFSAKKKSKDDKFDRPKRFEIHRIDRLVD